MCMWELLFPSRNLSMCLEKRMESCWDGWVCMREMLEIAEELLEKKAMDLIWGSLSAKHLATDIPAVKVKDSPLYVLDLLLRPHEPHQTTFVPFLMTMPAPVLFFPLTFLCEPSIAITNTSSLFATSTVLSLTFSSCSVCQSFGGGLVVENRRCEVRSCSHGGLCRGLRVGKEDVLVSSAILASGNFLEESVRSLVSRLLNLRLIFSLLNGIFLRTGLVRRSLCSWMEAEWQSGRVCRWRIQWGRCARCVGGHKLGWIGNLCR